MPHTTENESIIRCTYKMVREDLSVYAPESSTHEHITCPASHVVGDRHGAYGDERDHRTYQDLAKQVFFVPSRHAFVVFSQEVPYQPGNPHGAAVIQMATEGSRWLVSAVQFQQNGQPGCDAVKACRVELVYLFYRTSFKVYDLNGSYSQPMSERADEIYDEYGCDNPYLFDFYPLPNFPSIRPLT